MQGVGAGRSVQFLENSCPRILTGEAGSSRMVPGLRTNMKMTSASCVVFLMVTMPLCGLSRQLDPSARQAATVLVEAELGRLTPSATLKVDRDHEAESYDVAFTVPRGMPSFLVVRTQSTRRGNLTIHLLPVRLPSDLESAIPAEDWANPARLHDFRAVVELSGEGEQEHVLSLNRDFFEAVTRVKLPYDLSGVQIRSIAIHAAYPEKAGQVRRVGTVRGYALTGPAMAAQLTARRKELEDRLARLPAGSQVKGFWEPVVAGAGRRVQSFQADAPDSDLWWGLDEELQELLLKSRTWRYAEGSGDTFHVGSESSLRRISGRHERFGFEGTVSGVVELIAARNEYESAQLVLLAPMGGVRLELTVAGLEKAGGGGKIDAAQFGLYEQIEQWVKPSPGTAQSQVGWMPDALAPLGEAVVMAAGEVKPIWVTVKVPADAAPGRYTGAVAVRSEEGTQKQVPLTLTVADFALPTVGRFRTQGHLDLGGLAEWYGGADSDRIRRDFYRLLLEHRFSPTSQYSARLSPEREDIPWVMEHGGNVILVGGFATAPLDAEMIEPAYRWLVEHGYIDQAIIYIGDETDDFEGIRAKSRTIRQRWPRLRVMVGGSKPRDELIDYVDVWDPITFGGQVYNFEPESVRPAVERGEEVFWYTCVGPRLPFANIYNDHPLSAIRALWWQAWKYGVSGFEYWWFNWWRPNLELSRGERPWPLSRTSEWSSRAYDWSNGDGLLVFPGPGGKAWASLRLSVVRDAVEDWEVLFLLQRAVEAAGKAPTTDRMQLIEAAQRILDVPPELTADLTHWSDDPDLYLMHRAEAYRLLAGLRSLVGGEVVDRYTGDWEVRHHAQLQRRFQERVARIRDQAKVD